MNNFALSGLRTEKSQTQISNVTFDANGKGRPPPNIFFMILPLPVPPQKQAPTSITPSHSPKT